MRTYLLLALLFCATFNLTASASNLSSCQTVCKCIQLRCGPMGSCDGYLPTECCSGNEKKLQYCNYIGSNKACSLNGRDAHCDIFCRDDHSCGR